MNPGRQITMFTKVRNQASSPHRNKVVVVEQHSGQADASAEDRVDRGAGGRSLAVEGGLLVEEVVAGDLLVGGGSSAQDLLEGGEEEGVFALLRGDLGPHLLGEVTGELQD